MGLKVIFLGTPDFAVASLQAIHNSNHTVLAVVTTPDKPSGRGLQMNQSAVKKYAVEHNLQVLQPEKLKAKTFLETIKNLKPDIMVVVAFRIMPEALFSIPKFGTFNLHGSLLPQLRGAAPINFAIINGLNETGVTTFFLDKKVDTGEILLQEKTPISKTETAGSLHDSLMIIGKNLVLKTLDLIEDDAITPQPQNNQQTTYAPKIDKEFCKINWEDSLLNIDQKIRGLSPYPCSFTFIKDDNSEKIFKIYNGTFEIVRHSKSAKNIVFEEGKMKISHPEGYYIPEEVQLQGKRKMPVKDFINGLKNKNNLTVL